MRSLYPFTTGHWADSHTTTVPFFPFSPSRVCAFPSTSGSEKLSTTVPIASGSAETAGGIVTYANIANKPKIAVMLRLIFKAPVRWFIAPSILSIDRNHINGQCDEPHFTGDAKVWGRDRKSTRLNSSHGYISYAVFCLKKKKTNKK